MRAASVILCLALALMMGFSLAPVRADDAKDQLQEALKAYDKGDYATALTALDAATALIRQKRSEQWQSLLPDPLPGWQAEDAQSTTVSPAVFGGGTSVTRSYFRDTDKVDISLVLDSPLMQGIGSLMSNPFFTNSDTKVLVINGRKMLYTKTDNSYQAMIGSKTMIIVKGSLMVPEDTLKAYLMAIKFSELEKAAQ